MKKSETTNEENENPQMKNFKLHKWRFWTSQMKPFKFPKWKISKSINDGWENIDWAKCRLGKCRLGECTLPVYLFFKCRLFFLWKAGWVDFKSRFIFQKNTVYFSKNTVYFSKNTVYFFKNTVYFLKNTDEWTTFLFPVFHRKAGGATGR